MKVGPDHSFRPSEVEEHGLAFPLQADGEFIAGKSAGIGTGGDQGLAAARVRDPVRI